MVQCLLTLSELNHPPGTHFDQEVSAGGVAQRSPGEDCWLPLARYTAWGWIFKFASVPRGPSLFLG